jgi:hypothetical protein
MSLFGAIDTAISGLSAQSAAFGNISDNVANSQTTGFNRLRKFGFTNRLRHDSIGPPIRLGTWTDAWCRQTDCRDVQLSQS